jgi:transmembrane protein TMEM220
MRSRVGPRRFCAHLACVRGRFGTVIREAEKSGRGVRRSTHMQLFLRLLHAVMAALFIFAAVLQYNDEDMVRWITIYLAAALVCIFAVSNRPKPALAAGVAIIAIVWAGFYVAHGAWKVPVPALFSQWEMKDQTIVAGREMDGLFIVFSWMSFAWWTGRKTRP